MANKMKPMARAQLRHFIQTYRSLFSNWSEAREGFLRTSGPVAQQIWFENLRSGAYRPVCAISILVAKGGAMLHQFLDIRNREVLPRDHDAMFERVCRAMREQFIPSIVLPLNSEEVCRLCEEHADERINDAHCLSALNAYLGNIDGAQRWIDILKRFTNERSNLVEDWEMDRVYAANALQEAIANGNVVSYLDDIRLTEESRILNA